MAKNYKRKPRSFLRLPRVKERTGLGRSTIYDLMGNGEFPQSIKLSERCIAWDSDAIDAWIEEKINQSTAA